MAKYVFFKGFFDTLDLFSDELIIELENRGDKCICLNIDSMDRDIKKLFKEHSKSPISAAIAFNNLGYNLGENEGGNIWERLGIEYIDILMDHPFHFCPKLKSMPSNTFLYCIDKNHVDFVKKYYPNILRVKFLPHAGCKNAIDKLLDTERDIDILYAGSLSRVLVENLIPDFEQFKEIDGLEFSERILGTLIESPDLTTEEVIVKLLKEEFSEIPIEKELDYIDSFRFADGFAVSFFRELSVRILVENGFKVGVLGLGWEQCEWADNNNLILLGKVDAGEVLSYMKRSKIVLNTMTWFKRGAHDRVFNGQLAGAAVVTDTSGYINEQYSDGENIVTFNLREMSRIPDLVNKLLLDEKYRMSVVDSAYRVVAHNHTWANRLETILEDIQSI